MAEAVKNEILERLRLVDATQLTELCNRLKLTITTAKEGNKSALFNLVSRHILSEELEGKPDEGLSEFTMINDELEVLLNLEGKPVVGEVEEDATTHDGETTKVKTKIEVHKLQNFKISGSVCSGENMIDYYGLRFQMEEGKTQGYGSKVIMSAVIKAMKAGSSVRRYFEGKVDLTEKKFLEILRSHYNVKDAATLLDEMVNSHQEPSETEMNYVMRVMDLRNKIMLITKDEDCPLGEALVKKRFFYTLSVGFQKDSIRLEMMNVLKNQMLEDEELVREVKEVVNRDNEHKKKCKSKMTMVNALDGDWKANAECKSDTTVLAEICKLTAKVNELSKMRGEMEELRKHIYQKESNQGESSGYRRDDRGKGDGSNQWNDERNSKGRRKFVKCGECEKTNAFCTHCSKCGSGDHKRNLCTQKNE